MLILEFLMFGLLVIIIGLMVIKIKIKKLYLITLLSMTAIILLLHLLYGSVRWQFFPLYLAILVMGTGFYLTLIKGMDMKRSIRRWMLVISSIFFIISLGATLIFPVYQIPNPNGDYEIGTVSYIIEDASRKELYSDEIGDVRRIKIQVWYPADSTDGYELAPWLEDGVDVSRGLSKDMGFPFFLLDHTANIMSNSYVDAPLNGDFNQYPVVIISHGWGGFKNIHTDLAEELASNGYIVVGIDHTYGSVATVFEDDVVNISEDALPQRDTVDDFLSYANQLVNTYAGDITTTINYLEEFNEGNLSSKFHGRLDLTKIGLLGHSTGGGAGVTIALKDERIDALIGLDAWVEPIDETDINQGLLIPSLFLRSESWEEGFNNTALMSLINQSDYPPLLYQIDGTTHFDFAMVYMYSPLTKYIGFSGDIDSEYLNSIMKTMMLDFFASSLGNIESDELDTDMWDEVKQIR